MSSIVNTKYILFEEYIEWWSLRKKIIKNNHLELLAEFEHVQSFIYYRNKAKKENNRIVQDRVLMIDRNIHPCDLFLNYLLKIKFVQPTKKQIEVYESWFSGFNTVDKNIGAIGWVDLESLIYAMPFLIGQELRKLPSDYILAPTHSRPFRLFNQLTYYDFQSDSYQTKRVVNARLISGWNKSKFIALDKLGLISNDESWTKSVFANKKGLLYLKVLEEDTVKVYRLRKMS